LVEKILSYLLSKPCFYVFGTPLNSELRKNRKQLKNVDFVPTISFVHSDITSEEIVSHLLKDGICLRSGHMYAKRLCNRTFELLRKNGIVKHQNETVVRISALHYNTTQEIDVFINSLDVLIKSKQ